MPLRAWKPPTTGNTWSKVSAMVASWSDRNEGEAGLVTASKACHSFQATFGLPSTGLGLGLLGQQLNNKESGNLLVANRIPGQSCTRQREARQYPQSPAVTKGKTGA